ncbi:MAG: dihydrolipoamide acetyltransferase family protein [Vicinamibacterales bacterium]
MAAVALVKVVMPQMGESLTEGTLVRWLKAPGDAVARDEALFEISTDKVDTDVPAPSGGILKQILVQEGQTVAVGEPVALLESADATAPAPPPPAVDPHALDEQSSPPRSEKKTEEPGGHFTSSHAPQVVSFRRGLTVPTDTRATPRSFSPAVLETARRGGMSLPTLTALSGSGRGGRITKADVERFLAGRASAAPVPADVPAQKSTPPIAADVPAEYLYRPGPDDRRMPMSPVRRKIARHMTWSARISPQATAETEIDMSRAQRRLDEWRQNPARDQDAPLTYTVLAALAAVKALADFPVLNSSVLGDDLVLKPNINLGIAVALPDTDELIVPVVHGADELSAEGMARAIHDLASRARGGALRNADVQGGTFTLTNPGIFGGLRGTPILNQPQVAILGLGAITPRPVAINDALAIRPMMNVSMTFDHRATDGMVAFRYLARLRQLLEEG